MSRITRSQVETHQRKLSNVTTTANIPLGYKVHQQHPSSCQKYLSQRSCGDISMFEFNQQTQIFNTLKPTEKQLDKFLQTAKFNQETDKIILINKMRDYIEQGMTAYEEDINCRREKLRAMIQTEETELMRELVNQVDQKQIKRIRQLRKDNDKHRIKDKEHQQRTLVVALKRQQQLLETSPEVRDKISREMTRSVKYSNLTQILDKVSRIKEDKQLDTLWHKIMLKNSEIQRRREEEVKKNRRAIDKSTSRILEQQITARTYFKGEEERRQRDQERQEHEHLRAQVQAEEKHNLTQKQTKCQQFKRDLEEQLMLERKRLAENARQEFEAAQKLKAETELQLAKEKKQITNSAESFKKEMTAYMKGLVELRAEEAKKNAQVNSNIEQSAKDTQTRQDFAIRKDKEMKKSIFQQFIAGRENQLKIQREIEQEKKLRLKEEQEMDRKNVELNAAAYLTEVERKRKKALQYGQELQAQLKSEQIAKFHDVKEHAEKHKHVIEQKEKYQKFTQELLNAPKTITPYAFKVMQRCVIPHKNLKQITPC